MVKAYVFEHPVGLAEVGEFVCSDGSVVVILSQPTTQRDPEHGQKRGHDPSQRPEPGMTLADIV